MPFLVACSSTMRTPELEEELKKLGFSMFIGNPVTSGKINELIMILEEREEIL